MDADTDVEAFQLFGYNHSSANYRVSKMELIEKAMQTTHYNVWRKYVFMWYEKNKQFYITRYEPRQIVCIVPDDDDLDLDTWVARLLLMFG